MHVEDRRIIVRRIEFGEQLLHARRRDRKDDFIPLAKTDRFFRKIEARNAPVFNREFAQALVEFYLRPARFEKLHRRVDERRPEPLARDERPRRPAAKQECFANYGPEKLRLTQGRRRVQNRKRQRLPETRIENAAFVDEIADGRLLARELGGTLSRLDDALESVPAYGQARRNFRAASQQLEPFEQSRVPGQIIERDQYGRRNVMPADRVPQTVQQGGPSAARDFNSVATPEAREAFEQNIITQVLDKANKKGADLSADSIRQALRQNEDVLRQYPGVRDRLESIAIARDGLARVEQLPIGKLAKRDLTTKKAVNALFPENPLPNSQNEIASTMEELARRSPAMARQLVRTHAELTFNEATQRMASGGFNQSGGAKFAAVLRGNPQQAANLEAAVRALPDGDTTWLGFNAFLENLEAQQFRQATGSRTAFKIPGVEDLKSGGILNNAAQTVGGGGMKIPQKVMNGIQNWNVGRNLDDLARLLTDPAAAREFRAIATAPRGSSKALALTTRLAFVAFNSRKSEGNPTHVVVPVGQNLR